MKINLKSFFLFMIFVVCASTSLFSKENFLLIDSQTSVIVQQIGTEIDANFSPCSTFKIALSLIGFDAGVLQDEHQPQWPFMEEYVDHLESWKQPQTPKSWMQRSCVWYSQVMTPKIGLEKIQGYLKEFQYGNQDMSGDPGQNNGLTHAWLSSSLQITPREQTLFLQKLVKGELPVNHHALEMTKDLLFLEEYDGWKLFGKTGLGSISSEERVGWFIGWIEKDDQQFVFAYNICDQIVIPSERIPRVKQLLSESKIMN